MPGHGAILVHIDSLSSHTMTDEVQHCFCKVLAAGMGTTVGTIQKNLTMYSVRML